MAWNRKMHTPEPARKAEEGMTGGKLTWFRFADAVREQAFKLSSSDCPMAFVLPDGRVVEPTSVSVDLEPCGGGYKYIVKLKERQ